MSVPLVESILVAAAQRAPVPAVRALCAQHPPTSDAARSDVALALVTRSDTAGADALAATLIADLGAEALRSFTTHAPALPSAVQAAIAGRRCVGAQRALAARLDLDPAAAAILTTHRDVTVRSILAWRSTDTSQQVADAATVPVEVLAQWCLRHPPFATAALAPGSAVLDAFAAAEWGIDRFIPAVPDAAHIEHLTTTLRHCANLPGYERDGIRNWLTTGTLTGEAAQIPVTYWALSRYYEYDQYIEDRYLREASHAALPGGASYQILARSKCRLAPPAHQWHDAATLPVMLDGQQSRTVALVSDLCTGAALHDAVVRVAQHGRLQADLFALGANPNLTADDAALLATVNGSSWALPYAPVPDRVRGDLLTEPGFAETLCTTFDLLDQTGVDAPWLDAWFTPNVAVHLLGVDREYRWHALDRYLQRVVTQHPDAAADLHALVRPHHRISGVVADRVVDTLAALDSDAAAERFAALLTTWHGSIEQLVTASHRLGRTPATAGDPHPTAALA
jgi:hypothetical protein